VQPIRRPTPAPPSGAAAWLADHLPAPRRRRIEVSLLPDRVALGVAFASALLLAALALAGVLAPGSALLLLLLGGAVVALALVGRFLALPTSPGLLAARLRLIAAALRVRWWAHGHAWLARWAERLDAREQARLAALAEERQERSRAARAAHVAVRRSLARFDATRQELAAAEAEEVARTLRLHQHRAVAAHLSTHALLDAELPGFGPQALLQLLKAGIRTAADIIDVRVSRPAAACGDIVEIETPGRGLVRVDGLGRKRAHALLAWRQSLIAGAGITPRITLPVADEAAIRLRHHTRRQALDRQHATAARRVEREETAIRECAADERAELTLRVAETRDRAAASRQRRAAWQTTTQTRLDTAQLALAIARRDLAAHRAVGFASYLRAIVGQESGR
jgi:hypothetical protein